jgi:hypothetical protein
MSERVILDAFEAEFRRSMGYVEGSLVQLDDAQLHVRINPLQNSVASIIQHVAGNMLSRFTDFLYTDGEKPDRDREGEFLDRQLARPALVGLWDRGWERLFRTTGELTDGDLGRVVLIRREPHTVAAALARQAAHYAWHAGQVALIAKHLKGDAWQHLTIAPGRSAEFNRTRGV